MASFSIYSPSSRQNGFHVENPMGRLFKVSRKKGLSRRTGSPSPRQSDEEDITTGISVFMVFQARTWYENTP